MLVADEYRKHAEKCRTMAERSPEPTDRAFWLMLAQNWQLLAQDMEVGPLEELQKVEAAFGFVRQPS
ncbi:MAG TPA: hypothetical protein VKG24_24545 [Pseudolabrys sp.]|nr:hypothetical protein [Pseudolabrys sp.]